MSVVTGVVLQGYDDGRVDDLYHHVVDQVRHSLTCWQLIRNLRSFVIRFDFESYVRFEIRFVVIVRFEIFESSALSIVIRRETIGGG